MKINDRIFAGVTDTAIMTDEQFKKAKKYRIQQLRQLLTLRKAQSQEKLTRGKTKDKL